MPVKIVTDSVACLPQEVVERYDIKVIPLEIIYNEQVYKDGVDITSAEFYRMLRDSKELPTTSAPPPEVFLDVYEQLIGAGNEVFVVCPSTKLTHVYVSASIAAETLSKKSPGSQIRILDSGTAAAAEGFVAVDAAKAAADGKTLADIQQIVQKTMKEVHVLACIDTIEYLARSGRVPYILAWANSKLKIKPIIELLPLGEGTALVDRVRTKQKAIDRVFEILEKRVEGLRVRIAVQHTDSHDEAEYLANKIKSGLNCEEVWIQDFTPVMGVHTGLGLVGVSYSASSAQ